MQRPDEQYQNGTSSPNPDPGQDLVPPVNPHRFGWRWSLFLVAGLIGFSSWLYVQDLDQAVPTLSPSALSMLTLGTLALGAPLLLHALRYHLILSQAVPIRRRLVVTVVLASSCLSHFLAAKVGSFVEPLWLKQRCGLSYWKGLELGLLRLAHTLLGLSLLLGATLTAWLMIHFPQQGVGPALVPLLSAIGGTVGLVLAMPRLIRLRQARRPPRVDASENPRPLRRGPIARLNRLRDRIQQGGGKLLGAWNLLSARQHGFCVGVAVAELLMDSLAFLAFALALEVDIPLSSLLTSTMTLNVLEYLPTPPAMLGVQDWSASFSLQLGNDQVLHLTWVVLGHRLARSLVLGLGAVPLYFLLTRRR